MLNEIDVLRDLTRRFAAGNIHYMLTGSMAMNYYAEPRMTRDIDVVVQLESTSVDMFAGLFGSGYYLAREAIAHAIAAERVFNLIHNETVIKVDCIVRKSSDYRQVEFQRRQSITIQDFDVWITSREDLIISKLDWARNSRSELQLRDVRNLLASGYDSLYVEKWSRRLGVYELWQECVNERYRS